MDDRTTRTERDGMGEIEVPRNAYYGASTARAASNFAISELRSRRRLIRALGLIKAAAARVNAELGRLDRARADAIERAAAEVEDGRFDDQFVVDVFQTGSGTSTHMNANEIIASRASELLGHERRARGEVHPNDHVNRGQSSNDVIPTCLHLAALLAIEEDLEPALAGLETTLDARTRDLWDEIKIGRTHLQDATPIRWGQVFRGYAGQIAKGRARVAHAREELQSVPLGGTAVGTGINTHPEFAARVCALVSSRAGVTIRETDNHFQAQQTLDAVVEASGSIRTVAVGLRKIADDVRWLASGPRCGLGELVLPELLPGSSIMPGKVNPVIPEAVIMACAHVLAADAAVVQAGLGGAFELNTMMPLAAHHFVGAVEILGGAARALDERCLRGLAVTPRAAELVEASLGLATALVPIIGYDAAAGVAREAARTGRTVREVARERTTLSDEQLGSALDPFRMTAPTP